MCSPTAREPSAVGAVQGGMRTFLLGVLLAAVFSSPVFAQGAPSGFELALHGTTKVLAGRPARFRGIAYKVHGLAELHPLPGGKVAASYQSAPEAAPGPQQSTKADARGFFQIDVPIPEQSSLAPRLLVSVGEGSELRTFMFPISVELPWILDLQTDRSLYEPGETVHVWGRLRDQRSRRPLTQKIITFRQGAMVLPTTTDESGVATVSLPIPKQTAEGSYSITAELGTERLTRSYTVGTRTVARLWGEVKVTPETAQPGQPVEVSVQVTAASGAPVRNAAVVIHLDNEQTATATSDAQGIARAVLRAPSYTAGDIGSATLRVEVQHPAYGSVTTRGGFRVAVPLSLEAEAVPPNGGLVPDVDGRLYVRIKDAAGMPPPAGTAIEVSGVAVIGGQQPLKTDGNGIAVARMHLPAGTATISDNGAITTVKVRVEGPLSRTATIVVPVQLLVEVVPTLDRVVVAPGERVSVALSRRRSAVGRPLVVELLSATGLVDAVVADGKTDRITLQMPPDRVGVMRVRARPLRQEGTDEGEGGVDALLVRPARPAFAELLPDRALYDVRATAKLTLRARADAAKSWVAVLVRDLALHQGEQPFTSRFLEESFERAVLDPDSGAKEAFLRTVMAAYVIQDTAPVAAPQLVDALGRPEDGRSGLETATPREVLRDPFPLADELRRRGIARVMKAVEEALAAALDNGTLSELTRGQGLARRFRPDLLHELADVPETLGQGELTLAMLEASAREFTYHNIARRVARARLVKLLIALTGYLDPGDEAAPLRRAAAREPYGRWLTRMVTRGLLKAEDLADPWGGRFALRPRANPTLILAREALGLELCSAGPDGQFGTADDVNDVFARVIPAGTAYALASGEDMLMERLSYLSPGKAILSHLLAAYTRVAAEVAEEQRGDAVSAQISEGAFADELKSGEGTIGLGSLGTIGHGGGSGSGGLYGSRAGSLRGRAGALPMDDLAQLVREKFPPTLLFLPSKTLDPSGQTVIEVKLPDAVTTYLVEAIVWSQDGWTFATSTRLRVDKETVVDAPVPRFATVGDSLLLPVRVRNSGTNALSAGVIVSADEEPPLPPHDLQVAAGDAAELSVPLTLTRPMDGKVLIGLRSTAGVALDAVRRPLTVLPAARRVRQSEDMLVRGTGSLALDVPAHALPREGAELTVQVGLALFAGSDNAEQTAWRDTWLGRENSGTGSLRTTANESPTRLATGIGASWTVPAIADAQMTESLTALSRAVAKLKPDDVGQKAETLFALAPAARKLSARRAKSADLENILRALRRDLTSSVAAAKDDLELLARLAAGLAATAPATADLSLVRELVRRVRRSEVRVGGDAWIAASGSRRHSATALIALAELLLGEHGRAFERVRTLARIEQSGGRLDSTTSAVVHLVAALLSQGPEPTAVSVEIDGNVQRLALVQGVGRLPAAVLAQSGQHRIRVTVPGGQAAVYVRATTEYGLPWEKTPERPGSLHTTIEGKPSTRDQRAALVLVVQNRSPRTIGRPILELSVPAGAELDEDGQRQLGSFTVSEPEATRGTLHLELRALPPGGTLRLPLPLRWSVAGRLGGLGVAAYPADQTADVFILKPRLWDIAATELKP